MVDAQHADVLARVVRGDLVESVHHGLAVALDGSGAVRGGVGDADGRIFARSSLKPLQAVAMVRCGLDVDDDLLALACASHSGEQPHLDGVRRLLASAGLDEGVLQTPPDLPLGTAAADRWRAAGASPSALAHNCSGKHAAMLATTRANGWDTARYRSPDHPLQRAVRAVVEELTGDAALHPTTDGCGAPLFDCSLAGLARAFATLAAAPAGTAERRVADAMRRFPELVGGTDRDVTALLRLVPGCVAKDGAEGVYALGLTDGSGLAVKVLDGSSRPRLGAVAALLRVLGVEHRELDALAEVPVLGHGQPVGAVRVAAL